MGKSRQNIFSRRRREEEEERKEVAEKNAKIAKKRNSSNNDHASLIDDNSSGLKVDKKKAREAKSLAKQKSENNRSLRRMKKRGVVRQMFEKLPKSVTSSSKPNKTSNAKENVEEESEYDIPSELYPGVNFTNILQSDFSF